MGLVVVDNVAALGAGTVDGQLAFIRLPNGHKEPVRWNADQSIWIGRSRPSMKQMQTIGMRTSGAPANWKYPASNEQGIADPPQQKAFGFEIHMQLDAYLFFNAGLFLQENLSAEVCVLESISVPPSKLALAWYDLKSGDAFLSPAPYNFGVPLLIDRPQTVEFHWYSTGWQRSPAAAPPQLSHFYPELYEQGDNIAFRNFSAHHRWVGGGPLGPLGVSGERTPDIPDLPGLFSWHRASDIVQNDNTPVGEWADYSGRGRTLQQGVGGQRPLLKKTGGPNGRPFVRFDGIDDFMRTAVGASGASPMTYVMVVAQRASAPATQVWMGQLGGGAPLLFRNDITDVLQYWAGGTDLVSHVPGGWPMPFSVITVKSNGASTEIRRNGAVLATGDAGGTGMAGLTLGARGDGNFPAAIDIAEFVCAIGVPDNAKVTALENALIAKYAIV